MSTSFLSRHWLRMRRHPVLQALASLKLAVVVILFFIISMIAGTLVESLYGREFAKRLVYDSIVFWAVLSLLFVNVLFAALVRLPVVKRLSGFYLIHLGMLTLLVGGTVTYFFGIDGALELLPNEPNNRVLIDNSVLYTRLLPALDSGLSSSAQKPEIRQALKLPAVVQPYQSTRPIVRLGEYDLYIDRYLPYALPRERWLPAPTPDPQRVPLRAPFRMMALTLGNERFREPLSLGNMTGYVSETKVGLLTAKLLLSASADCLENIADTGIRYLFVGLGECVAFRGLPEGRVALKGLVFELDMRDAGGTSGKTPKLTVTREDDAALSLVFYPEIASQPVTPDRQIDTRSDAELIALDPLRETPHVLFFGDHGVAYGKGDQWTFSTLELFKPEPLPWMGLSLTLDRIVSDRVPSYDWRPTRPQGGTDEAKQEAVHVRLVNRNDPTDTASAWASSINELSLPVKHGTFVAFIGRRVHPLPFAITLTRFKMDNNPGTNDPASYESFVSVSESDGRTSNAHVYMNHPLKRGRYTFYQSSFFPLPNAEQGQFGSVFSVNDDPGRAIKYLGSAIFVFGAILHYILRRRQ